MLEKLRPLVEVQWQGPAGRPPTRASRGGWGDPINLRHDTDGHDRSGHFARVDATWIRADSTATVRAAVPKSCAVIIARDSPSSPDPPGRVLLVRRSGSFNR